MKLTSNKKVVANRRSNAQPNRNAFTLVELAVMIGLIAVLITVLMPALAGTKPGTIPAHCLNNQRQLAVAWQMYANDNADLFVGNSAISLNSSMDWTSDPRTTNTVVLTDPSQSLIAAYIRNAAVYKCPADNYQSPNNPGPRARSVSCNLALGGSPTFINANGFTYFSAKKIMDLNKPGPGRTFVFVDEHPDSIDDALFAFNPGYAIGQESWRNLPASYHNGGAGISFADGHAELHIWVQKGKLPASSQTIFPVNFINYTAGSAPWSTTGPQNRDYEWMEGGMPYR
jgi:prepilin-type processing-associated H-X9-DG protein